MMPREAIKRLFSEWKDAHKEETPDKCRETFPTKGFFYKHLSDDEIEAFKSSFCYDGFVDPDSDKTLPGHKKLLFVLKESNLEQDGKGRLAPKTDDKFWFAEEQENIYRRKLNQCLGHIQIPGVVKYDFQYMNLNKRGGFGHTNNTRLTNYVIRYGDLIREEVEILDPDLIICCGCYDAFMRAWPGQHSWKENGGKPGNITINGKNVRVCYISHPKAWRYYFSLNSIGEQVADLTF